MFFRKTNVLGVMRERDPDIQHPANCCGGDGGSQGVILHDQSNSSSRGSTQGSGWDQGFCGQSYKHVQPWWGWLGKR